MMRDRAWKLIRSVRSRAAVSAALATVALVGTGWWWVRQGVEKDWNTQAVESARLDAVTLAENLSSGTKAVIRGQPYVILLADGRWIVISGSEFEQYQPPIGQPYPGLRPVDPGRYDRSEPEIRMIHFPDAPPDPVPGPSLRNRALSIQVMATDVIPAERLAALTTSTGITNLPAQRLTVVVLASPTQGDAAVAAIDKVFWFGLPAGAVFVALVAALAVRGALRPVEAIRARMADISARDLHQRVPLPPEGHELTRLAETTNATLTRLEQAVEAQRRFVADAAHELRTPLANLGTRLQIALAHTDTVDPHTVIAEAATDTVDLQQLANDLLLLTTVTDTRIPKSTVDFSDLVEEYVAGIQNDEIRLLVHVQRPALVLGNEGHLTRIVANLVDNATRYAHSTVSMDVRVDSGTVILTVSDDGPGIPEPDRERIFERFVVLDHARATSGTGLGLAIVRELATRHGGTVHATDNPNGATLVLTLPTAPQSKNSRDQQS